jgi:hypothetical protein
VRWRRGVLAFVCAGLLAVAALPSGIAAMWPREDHAAQKRDPRYVSQTGALLRTRRQAVKNANDEAVDHAIETCAAAGVAGLAARFRIAPRMERVAARYARDFEASARAARRDGCLIGLRDGG